MARSGLHICCTITHKLSKGRCYKAQSLWGAQIGKGLQRCHDVDPVKLVVVLHQV